MKKIHRLMFGVVSTAALALAPLTVAGPAQAASTCASPDNYKLANDYVDNDNGNTPIYGALPCGMAQDKEEMDLFNRYVRAVNYVKISDTWREDLPQFTRYQGAAKKILLADIEFFATQTAYLNETSYNTASMNDYKKWLNQISRDRLTRTRVTHLYRVMIFHHAYASSLTIPVVRVYQYWDAIQQFRGLHSSLSKRGKIKAVHDGVLDIPSFESIYTTFVTKFKPVLMRVVQNELDTTFRKRFANEMG